MALPLEELLDHVKQAVLRRGGKNGIRGLQRSFRIMDDNHSLTLTRDEVATGLADYGVDLIPSEMTAVLDSYDRNGDGLICVNEFFRALRGTMNERRRAIVAQAFNEMDTNNSNTLDILDFRGRYDVSRHPKVVSGELSPDDALTKFLCMFDCQTNPDGIVTREEFDAYYAGMSASIDNDEYFELVITRAWQLDEVEVQRNPYHVFTEEQIKRTGAGTISHRGGHGTGQLAGTKSAVLPGANNFFSTKMTFQTAEKPDVGRCIANYTGHIPGVQEEYGQTFLNLQRKQHLPEKNKFPKPSTQDELENTQRSLQETLPKPTFTEAIRVGH